MTDNRMSGIALIAGPLGGMVTMAVHPTGGSSLTLPQAEHLAIISGMAHSLAMISFVTLFLGSVGLASRLADQVRKGVPDRLPFVGLVMFGFACVAVPIAAAVSGFIVSNIMEHMARDNESNVPQYRLIIDAMFQVNQAFSRIFSVAALIATLLWSVSGLRNGGLNRGLCIYGCIVAPLVTLGIVTGYLPLNVHGMGIVVLAMAIWFVTAGLRLLGAGEPKPTST